MRSLLALTLLTLAVPATAHCWAQAPPPRDERSRPEDDRKALVGGEGTTWELPSKTNKKLKFRLKFWHDKEEKSDGGALEIYEDGKLSISAGFAFRIEEKDKKRFIRAQGGAFGKGSDPVLPFRLGRDTLVIESGTAEYKTPLVEGTVPLKGEWKRVKE